MTQKLPDGITELQFCNNPAGSAYCVGGQPGAAGHAQDVTPPAAPGFALQARPAAAAEDGSHRRKLQFAPGLYGPGRGEWRHARVQVGRISCERHHDLPDEHVGLARGAVHLYWRPVSSVAIAWCVVVWWVGCRRLIESWA